MLSKKWIILLLTALAPITWGTTYAVTTQFLPPDRPLLAAVLRALPAGVVILLITRTLPTGSWWWKSAVLGVLNIGAFFALLFIAAYRLPGGVAATVGAVQPLIVAVLASRFVGERLTKTALVAGIAGVFGVGLLVLSNRAALDGLGILAACGGAAAMAAGVVLAKRWRSPATVSPLVLTSWQLIWGGLFVVPLMFLGEGVPTAPLTGSNLIGYLYLAAIGTALAYTLWFRGIRLLPVGQVAFLGLLSPIVAVLVGWLLLGQTLSIAQVLGGAIVLAAVLVVTGKRRPPATE